LKELPTSLIAKKNLRSTKSAWLPFLDITLPDDTVFHLVRNNEDLVRGGSGGTLYTAMNFEIDVATESSRGDIPTLVLKVANVTRLLEPKLEEYDGGIGSIVKITVINSELLEEDYSELEMEYEVLAANTTNTWVTFTLGTPSLLRQQFPSRKFTALHCPFLFQGVECGYVGPQAICDKTLAACRDYGNSIRFGGFPGMRSGTVRIA
jgi:hypothetical protein